MSHLEAIFNQAQKESNVTKFVIKQVKGHGVFEFKSTDKTVKLNYNGVGFVDDTNSIIAYIRDNIGTLYKAICEKKKYKFDMVSNKINKKMQFLEDVSKRIDTILADSFLMVHFLTDTYVFYKIDNGKIIYRHEFFTSETKRTEVTESFVFDKRDL